MNKERIEALLVQIYAGTAFDGKWKEAWQAFYSHWDSRRQKQREAFLDERLCILISYGDSLKEKEETPLDTLHGFLQSECEGLIRGVHILPYFPYTSDDGFSISDYTKVRSDLGDWNNVARLAESSILMSDLVLNHCSGKHQWFQNFLMGKEPYKKYFINVDPNEDLSKVVRPRPHFVLSEFETAWGRKHVWTTFSRDQVDLNFENPALLFEILEILLCYVIEHGSRIIRLDAIAYLWKEIGTECIHHEKTHLVVQLMRGILDSFAPGTILITETNVPHEENISYFGKGDEAQLVYNFTLPPLLLYSVITGTTKKLQNWAQTLTVSHEKTCFFNFCASHDGIGLTPCHGVLSEEEQDILIEKIKARGGKISYKASAAGKIPYEMNISYASAAADPNATEDLQTMSFLATQAVLLSMPGVPGIYVHSLLGSKNWREGVEQLGYSRAINREKLDMEKIRKELSDPATFRSRIFSAYLRMINVRTRHSAFHPFAAYKFLSVEEGLFAVLKEYHDEKILCVINLSKNEVVQKFPSTLLPFREGLLDLLSEEIIFLPSASSNTVELVLEPYELYWLTPGSPNENSS